MLLAYQRTSLSFEQSVFSLFSQATVKRATCFATLLQNELNSDVARFTNHGQTCLATN